MYQTTISDLLRMAVNILKVSLRRQPARPKPDYKPYPKNVPGPVYVADGCCITCGVWELDAADHLSWDDRSDGYSHCYVSRQPETDAEFANVLEAIESQELDCIRVSNCSEKWRAMMVDAGQTDYLDED